MPKTKLGKRLREQHMRHHFQDHRYGYGVSSPLWDVVFRTLPRKRTRNSRRRASHSRPPVQQCHAHCYCAYSHTPCTKSATKGTTHDGHRAVTKRRTCSRSGLANSTTSAEARASSSEPERRDARPPRPRPPAGIRRPPAAGRPRGRRGGTRADQAVRLIKANPGITASEVAKKMKIKPNYLYRVLGDLQKEGRVKKPARSYSSRGR